MRMKSQLIVSITTNSEYYYAEVIAEIIFMTWFMAHWGLFRKNVFNFEEGGFSLNSIQSHKKST